MYTAYNLLRFVDPDDDERDTGVRYECVGSKVRTGGGWADVIE